MYFLRKIIFHFPSKRKISYFWVKRNTIFLDNRRKIISQYDFFGKTIFPEHLKKMSYLHVFLEKDNLSFSVQRKNIMFLGKKSTIFPHNTRKIIFWCGFFGKTIFSEHLQKENMFLCAVLP